MKTNAEPGLLEKKERGEHVSFLVLIIRKNELQVDLQVD